MIAASGKQATGRGAWTVNRGPCKGRTLVGRAPGKASAVHGNQPMICREMGVAVMADKVEREIEEILARLENELPPADDRKPISILSRGRRQAPRAPRPSPFRALHRINPTSLMFTGAGLVVGGLVLSNAWGPLIWVSIAGVVLFLGAFLSSFVRERPAAAPAQKGVYWRDRYIEYAPPSPGLKGRIRRFFRR